MLEILREKRKFILVLLVLTVMLIIGGIAVSRLKDTSINQKNQAKSNVNHVDSINYATIQSGIRENNSFRVKEDQRVKYLIISNTKIVYQNEISKLTAEVLNTSKGANNLKLKVIFLSNDSEIITEKEVVVGSIKTNETINISIELETDITNTDSIRYEIID